MKLAAISRTFQVTSITATVPWHRAQIIMKTQCVALKHLPATLYSQGAVPAKICTQETAPPACQTLHSGYSACLPNTALRRQRLPTKESVPACQTLHSGHSTCLPNSDSSLFAATFHFS